jgi:hypothetical protein
MNKIAIKPTSSDDDMTALYFDVERYVLRENSHEADIYGRYFSVPGGRNAHYPYGRYRLLLDSETSVEEPWVKI